MWIEGDVPYVSNGNCYNNNGWNDWSWIIGLAVVGGIFGNGGFGFGNGGNRGNCATQADLSAGFANSEIMSDLNDILLGQAQMQNFINQGFAGLNQTINNGFAGVNNAVCTLGYQNQAGVNQISNLIQSCCCDLKQINLENRYLNEKQTCDIVSAINAGNQRLVDIYNADKMASKDARIATLEGIISNKDQTETILRAVNRDRCPEPAYIVPNPNCCYNYGVVPFNGYGTGCGGCTSVQ